MFCTQCGKEFEEENLFCPFCGAPVEDVEAEIKGLTPEEAAEWRASERDREEEQPVETPPPTRTAKKTKKPKSDVARKKKKRPEKTKKSSKKGILIAVIIAVVLIGGGVGGYFFYQAHQSVEIDLCDLMTEPEFEGDNGQGSIANSVIADEDKIDDVAEQFKSEEKQSKVKGFLSTVAYTVSPADGLKNGDKIKIIATYNEELEKVLKLDLTGRETTITVKGLKQSHSSSSNNSTVSRHEDSASWESYAEDFIFPYSSDEYLNESDVSAYSKEDIQWAINEIYARHGYIFDMEPYQSYFSNCSWYTPKYTRDQFDSSWLNTYEAANIKFLSKYR